VSFPQVDFGSICKLQNGRAFKPTEWCESGVPIIRIQNLNNESKPFNYCDSDIEEKYHVKNGDLLFSWSGTPGTSFGAFFWNRGAGYLNQHIFLVNLDEDVVSKDYLRYALNSQLQVIIDQSHGGVGLQHITKAKLEKIKIPLPPLETQKQIAAVLEKADQLRKDCKQMEQELNSLAQSVFIDMFGDPLINEKSWVVNSLEALTTKITDGKHGDCVDEKDSGYFFVSAKNIRNGKIDYDGARQINKKEFEEVHRRTDLKPGDLVMINTGATIGRLAIADNDARTQRATFQKSVAVIKPNIQKVNRVFLKYVFMLRVNDFAAVGTGSAIKNLLLSQMKMFPIIKPPLELQNKFAVIEGEIRENTVFVSNEYLEADCNFKSLMQKAFKGELSLKSTKKVA
jgi:type I restriction enzyme S subunit